MMLVQMFGGESGGAVSKLRGSHFLFAAVEDREGGTWGGRETERGGAGGGCSLLQVGGNLRALLLVGGSNRFSTHKTSFLSKFLWERGKLCSRVGRVVTNDLKVQPAQWHTNIDTATFGPTQLSLPVLGWYLKRGH